MEHQCFTDEIRSIAVQMTEHEIEYAMNQLAEYKKKNYQKNSKDKSEFVRLLTSTRNKVATLNYHTESAKTGQLTVYGVTLLSKQDYLNAYTLIPPSVYTWMLDDCTLIVHNNPRRSYRWDTAVRMRPILFIQDMQEAGLELEETFYICDEEFVRISDYIAIKKDCSSDRYTPEDFLGFRDRMRKIINKWYGKLRAKHKRRYGTCETNTVHDDC